MIRRMKSAIVVLCLFTALSVKGQTGTLPVLYLTTQNKRPIISKATYLPGTYYLVDGQDSNRNLGSAESPLSLEIRGRGHSSWNGAKKPYKLRLSEKKSPLGMSAHKHWALLKFNEPTVAGLELGRIMGMDWTASTQPVEVVLNGDYIGLYLLTETNRIGKNRLNIWEQPDGNEDEETIPYGWLVEVDNYLETNQITIQENSNWKMRITHHSPESLSPAQQEWLISEFTALNAAIYAEDKSHSTWEELLDVDAMARYFIIQEVMDNTDGFHGSFYLHKDQAVDARWVAGPLWDLSSGQRTKTDYTFRMKTSYAFTPHWIGELIKDEDFCCAVKSAWETFYPSDIQSWMESIDKQLLPCSAAFEADKKRWPYSNTAPLPSRLQQLKTALLANVEWFRDHLPVGETPSGYPSDHVHHTIAKVEYINPQGLTNSHPWKGINLRVTTYDDGTTETTKVVQNSR